MIHEIAGHSLAHALYSYIRHHKRPGISVAQRRRIANRKRRWFVDNIIMHHKRLHDRNRELIISNVRSKIINKRNFLQKPSSNLNQALTKDDFQKKWRDKPDIKERGSALRGRVDTRKLRARSRWLSISATA